MEKIKIIVNADGYDGHQPMRICPHCKVLKPLSEFGFRRQGEKVVSNEPWCKKCRSSYNRS